MHVSEIIRTSYGKILRCSLVNGVKTVESVNEFVSILNDCTGVMTDASYELVKCMYNADKYRFLLFITGSHPLQHLILWTTAEDIVDHFKLNKKISLEWDHQDRKYKGGLINPDSSTKNVVVPSTNSKRVFIPEDEDEDMERVYEYMQSRLASLKTV